MTDEQWKRTLALYEAASNLPETAVQNLLETCADEPEVVQEVTEMLRVPTEPPASEEPPRFAGCVIGRYEVIDLLGRGSTGEVYSGRDHELGRPVALKIMSPEYASLGAANQRFLREAQAASALNHPNIVTVHEVITWKSTSVIAMELVEGSSLRTLCGRPMRPANAIRIGSQALHALAFAHSNGIVHRDFKPENVIVRPDGYVKVLDFGLARRTFLESGRGEVSSTSGLPVGTLRYMSPEQCRGESATEASDVFAAGIVLYEMLAGRHPFHADSPLDTAHGIAWLQPRPPAHVNPEVSPAINSLIMRMLAKDAGARPSSTQAAEELAASGLGATETSGHRRAYRAYALAAALTLSLLGGAWFKQIYGKAKPAYELKTGELQIMPLANLPGQERKPSLSADGNRVAFEFADETNQVPHIYVKDLSDSSLTRVTHSELPEFNPVFSPVGTKLACLRPAGHGRLRVLVAQSPGGHERQVGEVGETVNDWPVMTWDGQAKNLFVSEVAGPDGQIGLVEISVETGVRRQITFPRHEEVDFMPAVSPDSQTLGFVRRYQSGLGDIWAMPIPSGPPPTGDSQKRRLTDSSEAISRWNWSADGRELLLSFSKSGRTNLWRKPVSGGPLLRVGGLDDQVKELAVARIGNRLVYAPGAGRRTNVWKYSIAHASDSPQRLIASATFEADARYSPDGEYIAFSSMRSGQGQMDIWITSKDGSNPRKMSLFEEQGEHTAGSASWSPDGRWLAFDGRVVKSDRTIYVLDVLSGKPRPITGAGPNASTPNWSRDGHWVYYSSDRGGTRNIWKVSPSGGDAVQVTRNGGFECFESPDGQFLYYTKRDPKGGFWRMPLAGGAETFVSGLEALTNRYWDNSPKGIYFVAPSKHPILELFHFSTGKVSRVRKMPVEPATVYRGLSVAPDGRTLLYVQGERHRSNLMIVNNFK